MAVRVLGIDIMSYLKGDGFKAVDQQVNGLKKSLFSLKEISNNSLLKMAAGYFTLNTLMSQYNKAVEASNVQIENETKLYTNLKAQNYRDEQIEGLKKYAGELQTLGVIGDEASLASIRQLASFKLQEESIRELLPNVHNLMVAEKGLNSTIADGEKWSKSLGIAVSSGQVRALKAAGVVLDEHTSKLFENANEQERVAILSKELKERIGEQNAEILKTPEGKIVSAQNRIGDVYEYIGGLVREERAEFWSLIADNAEWVQTFLGGIIKAGAGVANTLTRTIGAGFNLLKAMPPEARTAIKLLTGFLMLKKFPVAGAFLVIEDIFAAFQGKESFTEDAVNAIFKFFNTDYNFTDLRKGIVDFWNIFIKKSDDGIEKISLTTKVLSDLLDLLKGGAGLFQIAFGISGGLAGDIGKNIVNLFKGEELTWDRSFGNIKSGWNKIHGARAHMNETGKMYENFKYDEALEKQQVEFNKMKQNNEYIANYKESTSAPLNVNIAPSKDLEVVKEKFFQTQNISNVENKYLNKEISNIKNDYLNKNISNTWRNNYLKHVKNISNYENSTLNEQINTITNNKNIDISKAVTYSAPRLPKENIAKDLIKSKVEKTEIKNENKKFEYINKATYEINITETQNSKETARLVENIIRRHDEDNMQRMKAMAGGNYSLMGG